MEVVSFEMPGESVSTVTRSQSWRQRITNFRRWDREAKSHSVHQVVNTVSGFNGIITFTTWKSQHSHRLVSTAGSDDPVL